MSTMSTGGVEGLYPQREMLMKPRVQSAFWQTLAQLADRASYEAPAHPGAWQAFRLVAELSAAKAEHWRKIAGPVPPPPTQKASSRL